MIRVSLVGLACKIHTSNAEVRGSRHGRYQVRCKEQEQSLPILHLIGTNATKQLYPRTRFYSYE